MKRMSHFIMIIGLALWLSGCWGQSETSIERIIAPHSTGLPLEGKWQVTDCLDKNFQPAKKDVADKWLGKFAEFSQDGAMLGEYFWTDPGYKTKRVDFNQYIFDNFGNEVRGKIAYTDKSAYIISFTSKDEFLLEFIWLGQDKVISIFQDNILILERVSSKVDGVFSERMAQKNRFQADILKNNTESGASSGLLLGVKYHSGPDENKYKTFWISCEKKNLRPIYETEDLFLPRIDGFWKVRMDSEQEGAKTEDFLYAAKQYRPGAANPGPDMNRSFWDNKVGRLDREILCIGNDYVAMEVKGIGRFSDSGLNWNEKHLRILPIDSAASSDGVSILDLAGKEGAEIYRAALNDLGRQLTAQGFNQAINDSNEKNFSLYRKTGHWAFKGRIEYEKGDYTAYYDYNINTTPPTNFIKYDILCIPWKSIKDKVPEAVDAYTSPSKDIAVVRTPNKILIFYIIDGKLSGMPEKKINIEKGSSVVMAEWALSEHMLLWDKAFMANETRLVNELK